MNTFSRFTLDCHVKTGHDALHRFGRYHLANERVDIVIFQKYLEVGHGVWINILDLHGHLATGQLLAEDGSLFQGIDGSIGVNATLKAERGISTQAMTACAFSYPCGMEVSAFEHHIGRAVIGAAALSAKHAGDTHGFLSVADGQVAVAELMFLSIKCNEWCTLWHGFHHNVMTGHHVCIKAMQGLSVSHHHIIGNVNDVVDGAHTNGTQLVLQPVRTFLHLASCHAHTGITPAGLLIFDGHLDGHVLIVHHESLAVGTMKRRFITILHKPGIQVACHAPMREGISTVGSDVHLNQPVALQMVIFGGRLTHRSVFGQYDDTIVTVAHTDFVFSTNHAEALHATQFGFLDDKFLVAIIEHTSQVCHNHFLSCGHIRSAAYDLRRRFFTKVNGCHMQVVRIRVKLACQHFTHI